MLKYTSMMRTALLVLVMASLTISPDVYTRKCYKMMGNRPKKLSLMVNGSLNFVPNVLGLYLTMNGLPTPLKETEYTRYIYLKEIAEKCEDSLPLPNIIHGNMDEMSISGTIFFGNNVVLERFSMKVRANFPKQTFMLQGNLNAFRIPVSLDPHFTELTDYKTPKVKWSSELTPRVMNSQLCMKRFNSTPKYFLSQAVMNSRSDSTSLDRYGHLIVIAYSDDKNLKRVQRTKYLVEIRNCEKNAVSDNLHVVVDDSIKSYEVNIVDASNKKLFQMKFLRKGDSFVQDTSPTYSQDLIPVITSEQQLTDVWSERLKSVLLHPRRLETGGGTAPKSETVYSMRAFEYRGKMYVDLLLVEENDDERKLKYTRRADDDLGLSSETWIF